MTTKTPTQYQHLEPRPGSITASYFSRGGGSGRRWSTRPSMVPIPEHPRNSLGLSGSA